MDNSKANPNQRSRHFIGKPPLKIPNPMRFHDYDLNAIGETIPSDSGESLPNNEKSEIKNSTDPGQGLTE